MERNYARNKETGEYLFFSAGVPEEIRSEPEVWQVWGDAPGIPPHALRIGEDPDQRCIRLRHSPAICGRCMEKKAVA